MRYRPLGARGQVVSAISLVLSPGQPPRRPSDWVSLILAALESGVSSFQIQGLDAALTEGLARALEGVERRLLFLVLDLGEAASAVGSLAQVETMLREAIERARLGYLDGLIVAAAEPAGRLHELHALKGAGLIRSLGAAGEGPAIDEAAAGGNLDVIVVPYSLLSGWMERHRVRAAGAANIGVFGSGAFPIQQLEALIAPRPRDRRNPLAGMGGYRFLEETRDWTAEELCIAYALTEPGIASILVAPRSIEHLQRIAAVAERDLPSAVAAQIEMARFSSLQPAHA